MAGKNFRTKTKGKGKGTRYPVGHKSHSETDLNIGRDKGSKSDTDLFSGGALDGPTSLDGDIAPENKELFGGDTRIDAMGGETSLALDGGDKEKTKGKKRNYVLPRDDWTEDPYGEVEDDE